MRTLSSTAIGVGFKPAHAEAALEAGGPDFLEIHAENYLVDGGPRLALLDEMAGRYPISLHGVALSLGGAEPLDEDHLAALRRLVDRVRPVLVSEHLAWSAHGGHWFADLLPPPLTPASLDRLTIHVDRCQTALGRAILVENPSRYVDIPAEIPEPEFLAELTRRTGCGLLVDVNNVVVSAHNLGFHAGAYLDALPGGAIGQVHLAGHSVDGDLLIDDHAGPVSTPVRDLFARLIARIGPRPTLIEWDDRPPDWSVLVAEARAAGRVLADHAHRRAA